MRYAHHSNLKIIAVVAAILGFSGAAQTIRAQTNDGTLAPAWGDRYSLAVFAGGYSPQGNLGSGDFASSGTVGGSAGVWVGRYVGARVDLLYAHTDVEGLPAGSLTFDNPNVWAYNGNLVLRWPVDMEKGWLSPYALGGLGAKVYSFDTRKNMTDFGGTVGAGIEYRLPGRVRWGFRAEVRDFISKFALSDFNNTQNDLIWTGGITVSFR